MSFTRFNYDKQRTAKLLQESTGPGRWTLNVPGNGESPYYFEDPHIRLQQWGGNLMNGSSGHPVDISSFLQGRNDKQTKYGIEKQLKTMKVKTMKYPTMQAYTDETRASHPALLYRDAFQDNFDYPIVNPQANTDIPFESNTSSRIMEKNNFVPQMPTK